MINKAQLERLFVSAVMLAFASLALSIVGIKSQLFQTIQFLLLFIALISLVVLGFQSKTIQFNANRLKKQIIGWLFSSFFSILICFCNQFCLVDQIQWSRIHHKLVFYTFSLYISLTSIKTDFCNARHDFDRIEKNGNF